jgi:hypothetical protein
MAKFNSDWIEQNTVYRNTSVPGQVIPSYRREDRRVIVCLCGSTRFKEAYEQAARIETFDGKIVLSVGLFGHQEGLDMAGQVKARLDELHLDKIDLADEVLVLNVGGYVGESTRREVLHAARKAKTIRWLEPNAIPSDLAK